MNVNRFFTPEAGKKAAVALFLSGTGSNAGVLLEYIKNSDTAFAVTVLVTDAPETSVAVKLSEKYGIPLVACDIRKFYPSIDQDILIAKFHRIIKDTQTLRLIELIVRSIPSGVPIGNYTSQWFANFFLQDFDHFVYEKLHIPHYLRYMDDMVFFSANKRTLHERRKLIVQFLKKEKLTIKPNWQIFKVADREGDGRALDFLGYKFFRDYTTVRRRTYYRGCRRIKKASAKPYLTARDASAIMAYHARFEQASGNQIYRDRIARFVSLGKCRYTISRHDRLAAQARKKQQEVEAQ